MANDIATRADAGTDLVDADFFQPASIFEVERFEQVMRVADVMSRATTIPDHLKSKNTDKQVAYEETRGNCFMICNQAANWGLDPFAVAQASAFVFGKIVLEGKLVRAVIRKKLGFDLSYRFFGDAGKMDRRVYASDKPMLDQDDQPLTEDQIKRVIEDQTPGWRITTGTLQKWHTKTKEGGVNDNWKKDEEKMFRERGSREWCREWVPGLMLGVYTPDEFDEVEHTARSNVARDITHNPLLDGGSRERSDPITGEILKSEAQRETTGKKTSSAPKDDESRASAKPASDDAGRGGGASKQDSRPTNSSSAAPREDGDGADRRGQSPAPLSADILKRYASAMARMNSTENVDRASDAFWKENGGAPGKDTAHYDLAVSIYKRQFARAKGDIEPEGLMDEINAEVDTAFGADKFPGDI